MIFRTRNICCVLFLCLLPTIGTSQFGVGVRSQWVHNGYWHDVFEEANGEYPRQSIAVYGMYWLRLKEKRVEFLPEVGYFFSGTHGGEIAESRMSGITFRINTDIYFLDLSNDCNCPTFSKQNDFLKRGLFLEVSPGVEFRSLEVDGAWETGVPVSEKFNKSVFGIYAGLGLDFGLSDLITITPSVGLRWLGNTEWDGLDEFLPVNGSGFDDKGKNQELATQAGIRVLFRPDYVRRRR